MSEYRLNGWVIWVPSLAGAEYFPLACVQTGSEAQPASYTMGTAVPFPGGKVRLRHDTDHSPPSTPEVKNE
jgi:hypothetical protein